MKTPYCYPHPPFYFNKISVRKDCKFSETASLQVNNLYLKTQSLAGTKLEISSCTHIYLRGNGHNFFLWTKNRQDTVQLHLAFYLSGMYLFENIKVLGNFIGISEYLSFFLCLSIGNF